jgi:CTP:molybdopterin cytidylyltransferase MocA
VIAAVVLAAGASTRFASDQSGRPKQQLLLGAVLERIGASAAVDDVVVVTGAHPVEATARQVQCPDWEDGPGASLRCGLAGLNADAEAAVVVLADGPDLDPRAVDRVVEAWRQSGAEVVAATYGGVRLHPVLLARSAWKRVPNDGARTLEAELVSCDDLDPPGDVDFADDLPRRFRTSSIEDRTS